MEDRQEHKEDTNDSTSPDHNDKERSVQEQIDACQQYSEEHGLEVVGVFIDTAAEPPKS